MIYGAKCLEMVTLKVLPTTCFSYNSEKISSKYLIPKMKLNKIDMSFPMKFYNKIFRENDRFL